MQISYFHVIPLFADKNNYFGKFNNKLTTNNNLVPLYQLKPI